MPNDSLRGAASSPIWRRLPNVRTPPLYGGCARGGFFFCPNFPHERYWSAAEEVYYGVSGSLILVTGKIDP